jgi:uncharacterized protein (TIGR00369 family)
MNIESVPDGFLPVNVGGDFASYNGPFYARWHEAHLQLGFVVTERRINPGKACHGGMLSLFADIMLSLAAQYQTDIERQFLPTISLQTDFMASAPLGQWVQGQADILKVTRKLIFSQGLISCNGTVVVRASGVFRRGPLLPDTESDGLLQLPGMPTRPRSPG